MLFSVSAWDANCPQHWLPDLASTWGISRPRAHVQPLGFKRLHHNVSFLPQEMHTIEQARRVLDGAFTATITRISGAAM
jgi:hypothetical protein